MCCGINPCCNGAVLRWEKPPGEIQIWDKCLDQHAQSAFAEFALSGCFLIHYVSAPVSVRLFVREQRYQYRREAWARRLRLPMGRLTPHRETYWSRIRRQFVWNSQILIVSAVKICKNVCKLRQLLASSPRPLPGLRPWTSLGIPVPQVPWATASPNENS